MEKILIVDDEESIRRTLSILLKREGYSVEGASDGLEALKMMDDAYFDLIIVDLNMPSMGGIELLTRVKREAKNTEVIILTAYGSIQSAVEAIKVGAYDYLTKPIEPKDIVIRVGNALERKRLRMEVEYLKKVVEDRFAARNIIGRSPHILDLLDLIEQVSETDSTVLIGGESGTGKELVARAIHGGSPRKEKAFVPVNCGALPEGLLEGELFGYVKGAFTGAAHCKKGLFEEADQGTIFLDEVSATSPMTQIRLLRVLQEREIRRLGSNETIQIDVRVIAATNQDLLKLVKQGRFREDLYYRLNVISIVVPPLRDRKDDIPVLVDHFLKQNAHGDLDKLKSLSPEALEVIFGHDWPGNVRELKNAIERATVLATSPVIQVQDLPVAVRGEGQERKLQVLKRKASLKEVEKECIANTLKETGWNYSRTARELGIARNTLMKKVREYGLKKPRSKPD